MLFGWIIGTVQIRNATARHVRERSAIDVNGIVTNWVGLMFRSQPATLA